MWQKAHKTICGILALCPKRCRIKTYVSFLLFLLTLLDRRFFRFIFWNQNRQLGNVTPGCSLVYFNHSNKLGHLAKISMKLASHSLGFDTTLETCFLYSPLLPLHVNMCGFCKKWHRIFLQISPSCSVCFQTFIFHSPKEINCAPLLASCFCQADVRVHQLFCAIVLASYADGLSVSVLLVNAIESCNFLERL